MIKDLFKDIAKYSPAQIVPGIVGFISIPIITRLFPPEEYGIYALVIATVTVFSTLIGWLSMSIIRFYPAYEHDKKLNEFYGTILKLTVISISSLSIFSCAVLLAAKSIISSQLYSLLWLGIVVFIFTSSFVVFQHFLRARRQVSWYSCFAVWKSVTAVGFGLLLILMLHLGVEGLLWGTILSLAIILPLLGKKAIGTVSFGSSKKSISLTKEMARYSFPLVIGNLAGLILSLSDRYVLQLFRGSQQVGIYSASYNISEYSISMIVTLLMLASGPIGMALWEKGSIKKSQEFVSKVTRYYLLICIPAVVGLSVLSKPLIALLTGQEYFGGYKIIPLVSLGVFFLGLQQKFQAGFLYYKRTIFITILTITSGLLNLGLNFLLIPKHGYMAAALTTLISYLFLLFLMIVLSRRFFVWEFPFKSFGKAICASAPMGIVVYYIGNSLTSSMSINLISGICLGTLIYFVMLFLLREFTKEEIQAVVMLMRTRRTSDQKK